MKIFHESRVQSPESRVSQLMAGDGGLRTGNSESGFTMVEIAICLAVIGIALISIIGVLPIGMNTQRDNREETIINQDATVFIEAIRGGARGLDDLTNYVYAITNFQVKYPAGTLNTYGYDNHWLTSGMNIVGLLSTPEYTDIYWQSHHQCFGRWIQQPYRRLCPFHQRAGGGKTAAGQPNHSS